MAAREDYEVQGKIVHEDDLAVSSELPADHPARSGRTRTRRRRRYVLPVAVLAAGGVVALWVALAGGGDETVTARPPAGSAAAPAPADLEVAVTGPAAAVAGEPARFEVSYTDGEGVFAGGSEEWGDEQGASSVTQGRCDGADAPTASALDSAYAASHVFEAPGTYTVVVEVTTYTCVDGAPKPETARATTTVAVTAP
jgi:hypothetical protein